MFLEVIASDIKDIVAINQSNANRIEFCNNLEVGGFTPQLKDIQQAGLISKIPVNVIVRYVESYYADEIEQERIIQQVKLIANESKVNGIVIGALNKDNSINEDFLKKISLVRKNLEITFHRAFNHVNDIEKGLAILDKYNINSVLTTGNDNVVSGLKKLKGIDLSKYKVKILLGGGINLNNIREALTISNFIHIGRAARNDKSWEKTININQINDFTKI